MDNADVPYTYMCVKDGVTYTSKNDHFYVSNNLCKHIVECFINDDFVSDNAAVKATLSIAVPHNIINSQCSVFTGNVAWWRASEENITMYKNIVDNYLIKLQYDNACIMCKDVNCLQLHGIQF